MPKSSGTDAWHTDRAMLAMFIANRLGPRPRSVAAQDAAIARVADALDAEASDLAARGRRFLAIEYTALTARHRGGPSEADWQQAIAAVDVANEADVRRWARGGLSLRAAQGGWAARR